MSSPLEDQPMGPRRSARIQRRQGSTSNGQSDTREQMRRQTRVEYLERLYDSESGSRDKERPILTPIVGEPVFRDPRKTQNETQTTEPTQPEESKAVEFEEIQTTAESDEKPWETLVIGAPLGDNLSKIEYKDREILQQKFIVEWTTRCEPDSTDAQQQLLEEMIEEKDSMEADPNSHLPFDELQAATEAPKRLNTLRYALQEPEYQNQRENIEAAIEGYESGRIQCSENYTLLYAGKIVDTCTSYQAFVVDRMERLDRYYEELGAGCLWWEPPLTGSERRAIAKKGFCLQQEKNPMTGLPKSNFNVGAWAINMRFIVDEKKVLRGPVKWGKSSTYKKSRPYADELRSATFRMMLDTGATYPMLTDHDFKHLGIPDFTKNYAPQTVLDLETANGEVALPHYELEVGIGASLSRKTWHEAARPTGWPHEAGILGSLYPVGITKHKKSSDRWTQRLSSLLPFVACYVSSAPNTGEIWMGEDRRDVVGARRLPPFQRLTTKGAWGHERPPGFAKYEDIVHRLEEPDEVIFVHNFWDPSKAGLQRHFFEHEDKATNKSTYGLSDMIGSVKAYPEAVTFGPLPSKP
ncbi:hypothetical protein PFICI_06820 [Pestalotiopsis fici W106-1]|uniref:Uncharacterized protein n=1 Tax=Pestalotiopsis fici (strain W106-1 / CGMCC3.15140) TaxID=1229662 RepID=W3X6S8_PESFW|nr:uncharacterized protein PFICI_06820 [Pestalotiopsis fici W106-1]ETS81818.1 hypothetical protein PFICI_06820 [Pestalotiopsis fici W106-1]